MHLIELPGLPGEPPYPVQFALPGIGTFREGYVIKFEPNAGDAWVGNFQRGGSQYSAFLELHTCRVAVVAGGQGYVIDAMRKLTQHTFGGGVMRLLAINGTSEFLAISSTDIERHSSTHRAWRSERIAWDGIDQVRLEAGELIGRARHYDDSWHDFQLNLNTGQHTGGAYQDEA